MSKFHHDYFGVYTPGGKLDAVEPSHMMAESTALALSPTSNGVPQLNRKIGPVLVFAGTMDELIAEVLASREVEDLLGSIDLKALVDRNLNRLRKQDIADAAVMAEATRKSAGVKQSSEPASL